MTEFETLVLELPPDLAAALHSAVVAGEYGSVEEAVRDALLAWQRRRETACSGGLAGDGPKRAGAPSRLRTRLGGHSAR